MNNTNGNRLFFPAQPSVRGDLLWTSVVSLVYFGAARLGLSFVIEPEGIAPLWLPDGIFLSAVLLTRPSRKTLVVCALFITDFASEILAGTELFVSGVYALSLTGEAVTSAWLLTRFIGRTVTLDDVRQLILYFVLALVLSNAVWSLPAAWASTFIPGTSFWGSWRSWAASDAMGNLLIAPLFLNWASTKKGELREMGFRRRVEAGSMFVLLAISNWALFEYLSHEDLFTLLLPYSTFPFLVWAALRFRMRGVTSALCVVASVMIVYAVMNRIPHFSSGSALLTDDIVVQLYLAVMAVPSLFVGALVTERAKATEKLRMREALLNRAEEIAAIGSWEYDHVADRLVWSDEVYRMFGFLPQSFAATYQDFMNCVHPEDRAAVDAAFSSSMQEGRDTYEIDHRIVQRSTGEVRYLYEKCEHIRDGSGRMVRSVGMVHDVTERVRAEQDLRVLDRKNEEALRVARMGHWEFDTLTGLFTFNEQYYSIHGTTMAEAGGPTMSAAEFARRFVHPEDAHTVQEAIDSALAAEDPAFQLELNSRILRADGQVRWVRVWFRIEKDGHGNTVKLHGVNQDITDRRSAEQALLERNRYIETILDNAPIGFAVNTISDGKVVFVGGKFEDIYGVPRGSLKSVDDFFVKIYRDPEFRKTMYERIMNDMASGDVSRMRWEDIPIGTATGEKRFVTAINIPVFDQNLMVSTVQDVTARRLAEVAVHESEERYRLVFDDAPVSLWEEDFSEIKSSIDELATAGVSNIGEYLDKHPEELKRLVEKTRIVAVNKATAALYKADGKKLLLENLASVAGMDSMATHRESICAIADGKTSFRREVANTTLEGDPLRLIMVWSVVPGHERDYSRVLVSLVDITELKRVETALRESEERFHALIEQAGDGFELLDSAGRFVDVNSATCRQLGYGREELLTMSLYDIDPQLTREKYTGIFSTLAGRPAINFESTHRRKDGTTFPVEITTSTITLGNDLRALTLVRDITGRKAVEESLKRAKQFTDNLNAISKAFLTRTDDAEKYGDVLRVILEITESPYGVFGYIDRRGDLVCPSMTGEVWAQCSVRDKTNVFPESQWGKSIWGESIRSGEGRISNVRSVVPEGHVAIERCLAVPLKYRNRTIGLFLVANRKRDYTEEDLEVLRRLGEHVAPVVKALLDHQWSEEDRSRLQGQLLQSQKLESIGQLAGGIAHDFNNVLGAIVGYGNMMHSKMRLDDPHRKYVERMLMAAERATRLTQSLLAFSRKQVIVPKNIDLNACIKNVDTFLSRIIGEDVELRLSLSEGSLTVFADTLQIEQILMNLATNARDAMPKGGSLLVETHREEMNSAQAVTHSFGEEGSYAVLSVTDTGIGMDEETQAKIFDPFFTTKDVGRGTGLGLAIVYGVVKQNGGHINVYSELGKGTTFRIYFPLAAGESDGTAAASASTKIRGGSETILLAEDDVNLRELSRQILTENGYVVIEAEDGESALKKLEENLDSIHMIVTDVIMPRKSGRELYDDARKRKAGIKVLFMSGYPADLIEKEGILDRHLNFVTKPLAPQTLLQKVREVLDRPA